MKQKIYILLFCILGICTCSCAQPNPPNLTGTWKQVNSNSKDAWQSAIISDNTIEIYWVTNGGDTTMLYWSGTFTAPGSNTKSYTWESVSSIGEKQLPLLGALFASNEDTKIFTYENGQITYSVTMYGATQTVRLEKQSDENSSTSSSPDTAPADNTIDPSANTNADMAIDSSQEAAPQKKFDGEKALSQLDVQSYDYQTRWSTYVFLTIKNNSDYNLSISADVSFYDEDGNLVGAKSDSQEAVESGYETILYFTTDDENATSIECQYSIKEENRFECVLSDLSYDVSETKDKVILSVTNNGNEPAEFVEASVLFFNGDSVVDFRQSYINDDNFEIKPGKTVKKEIKSHEAFDSYKIFLSGRR